MADMTTEEILKKYPSAKVVGTLDNSEWSKAIEDYRKSKGRSSSKPDSE